MISSINIFNKLFVTFLACLILIFIWTTTIIPEAKSQEVHSPLKFSSLYSDKSPPQAAAMTTIRWTARATGGVGPYTYEFHLVQDRTPPSPLILKDKEVQKSRPSVPAEERQISLIVVDKKPVMNEPSPASEERELTTQSIDYTGAKIVQTGSSPVWDWTPEKKGNYRVKVVVRDMLGNAVDSGWSPEYGIDTFINLYSPVAMMPIANLSTQRVPFTAIRNSLTALLQEQGLTVVNDEVLESFMERHRIRYTGGIDSATAQAFGEENIAQAVLITTLEHYDQMYPPKISITSRLVSAREEPEILWMDSVGLAGHDTPKLLDLGLITNPRVLLEKAIQNLSDSFQVFLQGKRNTIDTERGWLLKPRFEPKIYYRSSNIINKDRSYTVAIMPFFDLSDRKYAGEIMALHFTREMRKFRSFNIIEPGVVREALLKLRVIMIDGISLFQAQRIFNMLRADFILTGTILDYNDYPGSAGSPNVDFSTQLIERGRETVWTSKSYNRGDDDVYFFDFGKINTANAMASEMVRAVIEMIVTD